MKDLLGVSLLTTPVKVLTAISEWGSFTVHDKRLELTVAQHSHRVADDGWNLHAAVVRASHRCIKTSKKKKRERERGSVIGLILCNARLRRCR